MVWANVTQISPTPTRPANISRPSAVLSYAHSSRPAAEEQFLEQNAWANPQHPVHRFNLNRQLSGQSSPPPAEQVTPAQPPMATLPVGSASTIVENPSAQASSMANTPYEDKIEPRNGIASTSHPTTYRNDSGSPFEPRKLGLSNAAASAVNGTTNAMNISASDTEPSSSPLATRTAMPPAKTASPPPRALEQDLDHVDPRHDGAVSPPPSILDRLGTTKDGGAGIMASAGLTRFKV